jgi:hypothetical protein
MQNLLKAIVRFFVNSGIGLFILIGLAYYLAQN